MTEKLKQNDPYAGLVSTSELERAQQGAQAFIELYGKASPACRKLLLETTIGEHLQAMFLGVKPGCLIESDYPSNLSDERQKDILGKELDGRFTILPGRTYLYDPGQVRSLKSMYQDYFGDMPDDEEELESYLQTFFSSGNAVPVGLLLGFPRNAVELYEKYGKGLALNYEMERRGATHAEGMFVDYYATSGDDEFKGMNREHLQQLMEQYFPDSSQEAAAYYETWHIVRVPGFFYTSGNPNDADMQFEQKVPYLFEASGLNHFLQLHQSTNLPG